ncbi:MAG: DUF4245 domain-containing protein [Actinomycetota bacterium]|nr:DUF4245 domain-containing protein [Actinomycetota bacterium]
METHTDGDAPVPGPVAAGGRTDSQPPPAAAGTRRGRGSVADMLRSLLVVIGAVVVVLAITPRPNGEAVRVVDITPRLAEARAGAPYDVVAPTGLAARWRATSARVDRRPDGALRWHVGFVTPSDRYAGVVQSNEPAQPFVAEQSNSGLAQGETRVAGEPWQRLYHEAKDQRSLWRRVGDSSVVVTGTAPWPELEELAASLRTR